MFTRHQRLLVLFPFSITFSRFTIHPKVLKELFLLPLSLCLLLLFDILLNLSLLLHVPAVLVVDHVADHGQFGHIDDRANDSTA